MNGIREVIAKVEHCSYLTLSIKHIRDYHEDYRRSIDGDYDGIRRCLEVVPRRRFEKLDLSWDDVSSVDEMLRFTERSVAEVRLLNLKSAMDVYINTEREENINKVYNEIRTVASKFELMLPNGSIMHIIDIVKISRDAYVHGRDKEMRVFRERTGCREVYELLTKAVSVSNDGKEHRFMSYDPEIIPVLEEKCTKSFQSVLEREYVSMLLFYECWLEDDSYTMERCIEENAWRPFEFKPVE